jgi:hypothetical protein
MTVPTEWDMWVASWRTARTSPAELEAMIERTRRTRRGVIFVRVFSMTVTVLSLAIVAAALRHAANAVEAALGLVVGVGIGAVWLIDAVNQRDDGLGAEASGDEYRRSRRALCVRQISFARLGWIVVFLDLVFLIPWWIGGIAVHGAGLHAIQLLTVWTPLALMAGFVAWTIVLRRRASAELHALESAAHEELA